MWVKLMDMAGRNCLVNFDNVLYIEELNDGKCHVLSRDKQSFITKCSVGEIAEQISKHYHKVTAVEELAKIFGGENRD